MGLETLAVMAIVGGGGMAAYGQIQQGKAAKAEGAAQNKLYQYNARVNEAQAKEAQTKALYEANLHRRQTRSLIGRQRAGMAAAGLSLTSGSPLGLLEETAALSETDAQMILREGMINRTSFESQAWQNRIAGKMAKSRGRNAYRASLWQAGSTALMTAGSAYGVGAQGGLWGPKTGGGGGGGAATYGPIQ
jgi:hypothetical protein